MKRVLCIILLVCILITACKNNGGAGKPGVTGEGEKAMYTQITQEEAKNIMDSGEEHIILDVREQDEFDEGHIPNAICIPNESITSIQPTELPDKNQLILVYCRSGNRSKQASEKLAKMGYTNIKEFGGIITWDGEIVEE